MRRDFIATAVAITLYRWRETEREGSVGATTLIAALLTFSLGAYAAVGDTTVAAAAAVASAVLLSAKNWLHAWVRAVSWPELRAALILLAMTFLALPILPDRGFGPYQALNPHTLWLMAIAIAGVSFIGYVAIKVAGQKYGILIAGVAGGLVSSTVATIDMARRARGGNGDTRYQLAGALAASATMFVRVGVVVALFGPSLLAALAGPIAAGAAVLLAVSIFLAKPWQPTEGDAAKEPTTFANPFELKSVLGFAALLAFILVVSKALAIAFGGTWRRRACRRFRPRRRRCDHAVADRACGLGGHPGRGRSRHPRRHRRQFAVEIRDGRGHWRPQVRPRLCCGERRSVARNGGDRRRSGVTRLGGRASSPAIFLAAERWHLWLAKWRARTPALPGSHEQKIARRDGEVRGKRRELHRGMNAGPVGVEEEGARRCVVVDVARAGWTRGGGFRRGVVARRAE